MGLVAVPRRWCWDQGPKRGPGRPGFAVSIGVKSARCTTCGLGADVSGKLRFVYLGDLTSDSLGVRRKGETGCMSRFCHYIEQARDHIEVIVRWHLHIGPRRAGRITDNRATGQRRGIPVTFDFLSQPSHQRELSHGIGAATAAWSFCRLSSKSFLSSVSGCGRDPLLRVSTAAANGAPDGSCSWLKLLIVARRLLTTTQSLHHLQSAPAICTANC